MWLDNQLRQSLPSTQLQKSETRRKRIRKSLENRTPHHFPELGTGEERRGEDAYVLNFLRQNYLAYTYPPLNDRETKWRFLLDELQT